MAITIILQQSSCAASDTFRRFQASQVVPTRIIVSPLKHDRLSFPKHKLAPFRDFNAGLEIRRRNMLVMKNVAVVHASSPPEAPLPSHPSPPNSWDFRTLGAVVVAFLSFSLGIWLLLRKLKDKVETTIEELEEISVMVEKVAEKVEELAEAAAKRFPDGKLHDAAEFIEKLAERIDEAAHLAEHLLEKMKLKVDELGMKAIGGLVPGFKSHSLSKEGNRQRRSPRSELKKWPAN